ncbi:MAG: AzlC family ABC transporter permease [Anaerolineae bacterium]
MQPDHVAPTLTRWQQFRRGAQDTIPLMVGAAPFGTIFGVVAIAAGLSPGAVLGFSAIVFAGSAQFIAAKLFADGLGIGLIIFTTFVVNLRHALYSASLGPYMKDFSQKWMLPLAFWLTDETYAVVINHYPRAEIPHKRWYHLGSALAMYTNWQLWTVIGLVAGTRLEGIADLGLEFALVVTFIGIVVPMLTTRPMVLSAVVAGIASVMARDIPNNGGLMVASVLGITAGIVSESYLNREKRFEQPTNEEART